MLVVTHSPQVAARADLSLAGRARASRARDDDPASSRELDEHERREEIARMLSGADITDEARAAAASLIAGAVHERFDATRRRASTLEPAGRCS